MSKDAQQYGGAPVDPDSAATGKERIQEAGTKTRVLSAIDGKLSPLGAAGLDNSKINEKQPVYNIAGCEKEVKGENNTRIVLGRDRNVGLASGYGGRGHTRSGAIDIVVGLQGWAPGESGYQKGNKWINGTADRNFGSMNNDKPGDAARIYISQRANIDEYFDICVGGVGQSVADSAIGMKADSVRIMARKGIKLVTGKNPPGRNSIDGKLKVTYGIDLIAGNRDIQSGLEGITGKLDPEREVRYLQPIPKGDNLVEYLTKLHENVQFLNAISAGLLLITPKLAAAALGVKVGVSPTGPVTTFPTPVDLVNVSQYLAQAAGQYAKLKLSRTKMSAYEIDYLNSAHAGALHINSRHNRTN